MHRLATASLFLGILLFSFQFSACGRILSLGYLAFAALIHLQAVPQHLLRTSIYLLLSLHGIYALYVYNTEIAMPEIGIFLFSIAAMGTVILLAIRDRYKDEILRQAEQVERKEGTKTTVNPANTRFHSYVRYSGLALIAIIIGNVLQLIGSALAVSMGATGGVALLLPYGIFATGLYIIAVSAALIVAIATAFLVDILVTQGTGAKDPTIGLKAGVITGILVCAIFFMIPKALAPIYKALSVYKNPSQSKIGSMR